MDTRVFLFFSRRLSFRRIEKRRKKNCATERRNTREREEMMMLRHTFFLLLLLFLPFDKLYKRLNFSLTERLRGPRAAFLRNHRVRGKEFRLIPPLALSLGERRPLDWETFSFFFSSVAVNQPFSSYNRARSL